MHTRLQILPEMAVSVSTSLSFSEIARSAAVSLGYSSLKPEQLLAISSFLEDNTCPSLRTGYGVTADLFRPANLFRRNIFVSVFVPVFRNLSGSVPSESC